MLTHSLLPQPLQGYLLPAFHKVYWLGLKSEVLPAFSWIDKLIPGPNATSYRQWGTYIEGSLTESEPYGDTETCAVANSTQAFGSTQAVQPWGWASQDCEARHTYLCRQSRECMVADCSSACCCCRDAGESCSLRCWHAQSFDAAKQGSHPAAAVVTVHINCQ